MLRLTDALLREMEAAAEDAYPNECCGFMLGALDAADRTLTEVMPAPNTSDSSEQYHRFIITPEQMLLAERYARQSGQEIIGFYHSHPDCPAVPSEYDRSHALPVYSYLIVSAVKGSAAEVRSWQLDPEDAYRHFYEETIDKGVQHGS